VAEAAEGAATGAAGLGTVEDSARLERPPTGVFGGGMGQRAGGSVDARLPTLLPREAREAPPACDDAKHLCPPEGVDAVALARAPAAHGAEGAQRRTSSSGNCGGGADASEFSRRPSLPAAPSQAAATFVARSHVATSAIPFLDCSAFFDCSCLLHSVLIYTYILIRALILHGARRLARVV
jgi:hypothetical protein